MLIDCDTCAGRHIACADCVINVLLSRPAEPVEFDDTEADALASLADAGLVPPLRLVPLVRASSPSTSDSSHMRKGIAAAG